MAGKMRSPNYPGLSLPDAIEAAQKLWDQEKRTAVSNADAAAALGFQSLSGPARVKIGALRQYGLIEKAEKGHIRLSDLAVRILHGSESDQPQARAEAAVKPPLFRGLGETHLDASEKALASHLITKKGFAENGARKAAKAFRGTLTLASGNDSGYNEAETVDEPWNMPDTSAGQKVAAGGKPSVRVLTWALSRNTSAELKLVGDVTLEDLDMLEEYVSMTKRALARERES